jgi:hypothetical protein
MAEPLWNELAGRLKIVIPEGQELDAPAPAALDGALDDLERQAGFHFPESYRRFLHTFGPGELAGHFHIYAPIPDGVFGPAREYYDIVNENEVIRDPEGEWSDIGDPELIPRLILFASTTDGGWLFWDPADVRDPQRHEYGVYGHAPENPGKVELVATSFKELITGVCLGKGFPAAEGTYQPVWEFWPAWPMKRAGGR